MLVTIVLSLGCAGCWQEIRYEPGGAAPSAPKISPSEPEAPAPEILQSDSASDEGMVELEETELAPAAESVETTIARSQARSPQATRTLLAAWRMCSDWSMAAALQAKGRNWESYGTRLDQAEAEAKLLEVELPSLPVHSAGADRLSINRTFLLEAAGPTLARELGEKHGLDHAALAELATKTNVLLLSYTPSSTRLGPIISAIRQAAESSGLPESVWGELVDLLAARAEFKQVKAAIFLLHQRATNTLQITNDE